MADRPGNLKDALAEVDRLRGEVERLQVRVTYREQTIDQLKAELERNNQAFQRLIPDAERADELEHEIERLRALLEPTVIVSPPPAPHPEREEAPHPEG